MLSLMKLPTTLPTQPVTDAGTWVLQVGRGGHLARLLVQAGALQFPAWWLGEKKTPPSPLPPLFVGPAFGRIVSVYTVSE